MSSIIIIRTVVLSMAQREQIERIAIGEAMRHDVLAEFLERRDAAPVPLRADLAMALGSEAEAATLQ